jgi:hypothetical protein
VRAVARHGSRARDMTGRSPRSYERLPAGERAPILKRYLAKVPGGRPHIPVDRKAPLTDFAATAARFPVFRVTPAVTTDGSGQAQA